MTDLTDLLVFMGILSLSCALLCALADYGISLLVTRRRRHAASRLAPLMREEYRR